MRTIVCALLLALFMLVSGCDSDPSNTYELKGESIYDLPERGFAEGEEAEKISTPLEIGDFAIQGDNLTATIQMEEEMTELSEATLHTYHEGYVAEKNTDAYYFQLDVTNAEHSSRMVSDQKNGKNYLRVVYFDRKNRDLTIGEGEVPEQLQRKLDEVDKEKLEEKKYIGFAYKIVEGRPVE